MVPVQADFLIHTGDFVENGASSVQWQTFFDVEAPLLRERCIVSCVGNHELVDGMGTEYMRYFGEPGALPEDGGVPAHLNGTFRWGNARFFLLNGMVGWKTGVDRAWLERALGDADSEKNLVWRIVVVHHGPWSSGPHGGNRYLHEAGIPALLRAHKVDLVVAGHDHVYERGWAEGMAYLVTGGGGAPTYRIKNALPSARKYEAVRHFVEASVSQTAINLAAIRPDGTPIERCALRKETGWDCDAKEEPASPSNPAASVAGRAPDSAPPASRCSCRVTGGGTVGRDGVGGGAGALLAAACVVLRRRRRTERRCARSD
jgi:predicted phosphodiesterase